MPSDPQNKAERPDGNVVALHRAEFVASIEKKLLEARRFFSTHDYRSCAELVQQVLAVDPQNSKAKALLDLSSIKLSKRKLYQKIAAPRPPASLSSGPDLTDTAVSSGGADPQSSSPELSTFQPELNPPPTAHAIVIEPPPRRRRRGLPESGAGSPQDSMRERTISALVDLLQNKEATLQDWKSDSQANSSATSASSPSTPKREPAVPAPAAPQASLLASIQSSRVGPHQPPPVLEANRDFLPSSLEELFEGEPAPLRDVEKRPVKPASVTPEKVTSDPAASSSEPKRSVKITRAPQPGPPVLPIVTPRLPEAGLSPPLSPPKIEPVKNPLGSPPLRPQVAQPAVPPAEPTSSQPHVIQLPDIRIFDQITAPQPLGFEKEVERKIEQRSEEIKSSEIQAGAIAQIKKYLYQEEYDLCARDLARIRELFPQNAEIQAFVENTSKRLVELQRIKKFEVQAKDLMASAVAFYQEGKREEALIAVREILRVNPNHVQAREFVGFVERHQGKDRKRQPAIQKVRTCRSCGSEVDAVSQFCYHCGKRL